MPLLMHDRVSCKAPTIPPHAPYCRLQCLLFIFVNTPISHKKAGSIQPRFQHVVAAGYSAVPLQLPGNLFYRHQQQKQIFLIFTGIRL